MISSESDGDASLAARIRYIRSAGPVVRLDLEREDAGGLIEAELPRDEFRDRGLEVGLRIFVKPRRLRVWVDTTDAPDDHTLAGEAARGWTVNVP
jgi:sulfate transport system ATP-binding protein